MSGLFTNDRKGDYLDPDAKQPNLPVKQIVAIYDSNDSAHVARDALVGAGVPRGVIHLIERADPASAANAAETRRQTFWSIVGSLFKPAEDPSAYHLAADPNHALVILQPDAATDVRRAVQVLRSSRPFYVFPQVDETGAPVRT